MANNPLLSVYNGQNYGTGGATTPSVSVASPVNYPPLDVSNTPVGFGNYNPQTQTSTQTLPYGGGIFNPQVAGGAIAPAPIFTGAATPQQAQAKAPTNNFYEKYRNPKTGEIMSPEEYAVYLGNKIPKGTGDITNYAGDALAKPDQSANDLIKIATSLNNARNDIATGTEDPYGVGKSSGVAYNPAELKAIESAYAGIYDPALNDAFSRLRDKQKADAKMVAREEKIFATNEAIRQWQATTGTKKTGGDKSGSDNFTKTQLNNGASNSGLSIETFKSLDPDIQNFYINPPMSYNDEDRKVPMYDIFEEDLMAVANGDLDAEDLSSDIESSTLPAPVKHYFIDQIDLDVEKKEGWFKRVWGAITGN